MDKLKKFKSDLFIGPMSKNCVDACMVYSKKRKKKIHIIASRRQIETEIMGGGYVNNWSTEKLRKYTKKGKIILCRDHGGPWQGSHEIKRKQNLLKSMQRAKRSFEKDIKNDFKFLHIDTSLSNNRINLNQKISRTVELLSFCEKVSKKNKKKVFFEVGWESENGEMHNIKELEIFISEIKKFCLNSKINLPKYITLKTGTKVFEDRNIGSFSKFIKNKVIHNRKLLFLKKCIKLCHDNGFLVKEHNADYMDLKFLKLRPKIKIDGVNIAPEFGTLETKIYFELLSKYRMYNEKEKLIKLLVDSGKWKKWTNKKSKLSNLRKAIIAGHYMYMNEKFKKIKEKLSIKFKKDNNTTLDKFIVNILVDKISKIEQSLTFQ